MTRTRAKRRNRVVILEQLKELVVEDSLRFLTILMISILVSVVFVYIGVITFNTVQENRWLISQINELQLTLENLDKEYEALVSEHLMYNLGGE